MDRLLDWALVCTLRAWFEQAGRRPRTGTAAWPTLCSPPRSTPFTPGPPRGGRGLARRRVRVVTADGTDLGRVRRPLPLSKALDDVLLVHEMNGEPLPPDHGHPVRLLVPSWIGIASIKWIGDIEVAAQPLYSPWNTDFYRLFGDAHPAGGSAPLTRADRQERLRAELGGAPARGHHAPAHRALLVRGRGRRPGRGQYRRRHHLGRGPAARQAAPGRLGPLVHPGGGRRPPAPASCWPGPPTAPDGRSRTPPPPTRRATCSTRSSATRSRRDGPGTA
ncbi:hypothetical protein STENM223S_01638 [Streptomyces tendae]